jgi:hypothetical protein
LRIASRPAEPVDRKCSVHWRRTPQMRRRSTRSVTDRSAGAGVDATKSS